MKLIITADDFGYNEERNNGIVDCYLKGAVTRTSLLVNGFACQHAVAMANFHKIPVGLHFNITEGTPVSDRAAVSSLLSGDNDSFLGKFGLREAIKCQSVKPDEIRTEIQSQIDRFRALTGSVPDYVDGHQHIHVVPEVSAVFASVLASNGVSETRLPVDLGVDHCQYFTADERAFKQGIVQQCELARVHFSSHSLRCADCFTGIATMGERMSAKALQEEILRAVNSVCTGDTLQDSVTCELMVHPGYRCQSAERGGCGNGSDGFAMSADREHEMNVLCSQEMAEFYRDNNVKLVSNVL